MTPNSYSGHYGFPSYQAGFGSAVGAYQPFGHATSAHIAKREAETEPEAEADPAAFYNSFYNPAYNMAYPYSRGSFYSGYRNFYQPSYYGGYGH